MNKLIAFGFAAAASLPLVAGTSTRTFTWCPAVSLENFQVPVALADGVGEGVLRQPDWRDGFRRPHNPPRHGNHREVKGEGVKGEGAFSF